MEATGPPPGATPGSGPGGGGPAPRERLDEVLGVSISVEGSQLPFGTLTVAQVTARADELRAAVGFGPTVRVAPVARAWRELSLELTRAGVGTVAELDAEIVLRLAPQMWVLPPGGSLL